MSYAVRVKRSPPPPLSGTDSGIFGKKGDLISQIPFVFFGAAGRN